jgi:branched-chain amino acid transport system ATP-binding protein
MLEIRNLSASPVGESPIHGVTLRVGRGRLAVLRGPNGAGKSTLCRCLGGLEVYTGGVYLEEHAMPAMPWAVARKGLIVLQKGRRVFGALTVEENLSVPVQAWTGGSPKRRLEEVYRVFPHLVARRAQQAGTLSGGEQQMVAIGRAILTDARVLVLDEPFLGLAPRVIQDLTATLVALRDKGVALLVTQEDGDLADIADDEYILEGGRLMTEHHHPRLPSSASSGCRT